MKPTIRRAQWHDVQYISKSLRPADARELQAAHPHDDLTDILMDAARLSRGEVYVASFDKYGYFPCILFGVTPVEQGIGSIWMVCTPAIKGHAISILREARHWIEYWHHTYTLLANYVEMRNDLHIRWLRHLGAKFGALEDRNGVQIRPFYF